MHEKARTDNPAPPKAAATSADLDKCLAEAKTQILHRCGVHIGDGDPVMAVLIAQDVFAKHHARIVEGAVIAAAQKLDRQLDSREADMRRRLDRHIADTAQGAVEIVHSAAIDQQAALVQTLNTLTDRQERAAKAVARVFRGAVIAAAITVLAVSILLLTQL